MNFENHVATTIEPALKALGYNLVRVQYRGTKRKTLQVMIERLDNMAITLDDCVHASRTISMLLDVENSLADSYFLEVSSPGLERPLIKLDDFVRFVGHDIKIELKIAHQGSKRFQGKLLDIEKEKIKLLLSEKNSIEEFEYTNIQKAHLVPNYNMSQ